jgi:hypothetical protein
MDLSFSFYPMLKIRRMNFSLTQLNGINDWLVFIDFLKYN